MCFMTFVSLSSCRLLLLQRWDNKWTETEDCRLYVICRYYFRLSVQNADTSAMISSGSEHTGRHSQDPAIWCDMLPHNNKTLQHGAGECVCRLQCPLLQHCMQQAVSPPALPPPPRGAAVPAAGENRNIFTPNFLDGTDWRTQPRVEKRSTDTIVMMKGIFFYFYFDHLALKKVYSLLINIPRQQNFIMALKRLDYECDILP